MPICSSMEVTESFSTVEVSAEYGSDLPQNIGYSKNYIHIHVYIMCNMICVNCKCVSFTHTYICAYIHTKLLMFVQFK